MKFITKEVSPAPPFGDVNDLEPGTLFEDALGNMGLRVNDGFVIFSNDGEAVNRQSCAARGFSSGALKHVRTVRALPTGTTFTLVQE